LLHKTSCLAPALGVAKFTFVTDMILVTLLSYLVTLRCSSNSTLFVELYYRLLSSYFLMLSPSPGVTFEKMGQFLFKSTTSNNCKFQVVPVGAGRVTQGAEVAILLAKPLSNEHRLKGMAEGSALLTSSSS